MFGLLKKTAAEKGRLGVAFRRDRVAVAAIRRQSGGPLLERCELLPIDPAKGPEAVGEALRAAALPSFALTSVLRFEDYQLALVEAPDVPPAELRAAMRWRLREAIDFKVEDAVIDVFDVPNQTRGAHGRMMYAIAARRTAVDRHAAMLAGVGPLSVVDVPELCLRNLAALLPAAEHGVALLHLGETMATVVLVRGRTFYFARQMDLQATLGHRSAGDGALAGAIDPGGVVLELQRSLDYYERHYDQPPITRVSIAAAGNRAEGLAADLGRDTGLEVTPFDLASVLRCAAPVDANVQAECLLAVGAALREENRSL